MAVHGEVYRPERRRLPKPRMMPAARPIESMPSSNVDAKDDVALECNVAFFVIGATLHFRRGGPGVVPFPAIEKAPSIVHPLTAPRHSREVPRPEKPFGRKAARPARLLEAVAPRKRRRQ